MRFKLDGLAPKSQHVFRLFLDSWLTDLCQGSYRIQNNNNEYEILFDDGADAMMVIIKDLPPELKKYAVY